MTLQSKKNDPTAMSHSGNRDRRDELDATMEETKDLRVQIPSAPKRANVLDGLRKDYEKSSFPSRDKRIAHLLMWCAVNYPGQPVSWKDIYQVIRDGERVTADELKKFEKSGGHVNQILLETKGWQRCLVREKSHGVDHGIRASTDDNDTALHSVEAAAKGMVSAHRRWGRIAGVINPAKVKDARLRKFLTSKPIRTLTHSALDADYLQKLLPPAPEIKGSKKDDDK